MLREPHLMNLIGRNPCGYPHGNANGWWERMDPSARAAAIRNI